MAVHFPEEAIEQKYGGTTVLATGRIWIQLQLSMKLWLVISSIIYKSHPEILRFKLSGFLRRVEEYHPRLL